MIYIALATYNPNPKYFEAQIESLIAQTCKSWKCLIYDDCSEVKSWQSIVDLVGKDPRFVLVRGERNLGVFEAFEQALQRIPTEVQYIALCDQDDIWVPEKLDRLLLEIRKPGVSLVHSDLSLMGGDGDIFEDSCWRAEGRLVNKVDLPLLVFRNAVTGCSCMFRRDVLESSLPFPKIQRSPLPFYHDVWIALHAAALGEICAVHKPLVLYRQHGGNLVGGGQKGKGLSNSFLERCRWQYAARVELIENFLKSIREPKEARLQLSFFKSPYLLLTKSVSYCLISPKLFKTAIMVFLGRLFSRK